MKLGPMALGAALLLAACNDSKPTQAQNIFPGQVVVEAPESGRMSMGQYEDSVRAKMLYNIYENSCSRIGKIIDVDGSIVSQNVTTIGRKDTGLLIRDNDTYLFDGNLDGVVDAVGVVRNSALAAITGNMDPSYDFEDVIEIAATPAHQSRYRGDLFYLRAAVGTGCVDITN